MLPCTHTGPSPPPPPVRVSQYTNVTMVILRCYYVPHTGPSLPLHVRVSQYTGPSPPAPPLPVKVSQFTNVIMAILGCYYVPHTGPSPPPPPCQSIPVHQCNYGHPRMLPHTHWAIIPLHQSINRP